MAPMKMECEWIDCQYATKEHEPAVAVELLKLHHQSVHQTHATGGTTAEDSRNKVKFPKPAVDQVQSLEEWETSLTRWAEYKKQMKVYTGNVSGQLISCTINELETSLTRILGKDLYNK